MAEAVGLASSILALTGFAFQSSKALSELCSSFQNHGRNVRNLKNELDALVGVLTSLKENVEAESDFAALKLPLLHCGKACKEFATAIDQRTTRTTESRNSLRDWLKLTWRGKDISGFTNLIAGYKATITIALGDANLRKVKITIELLNEYKSLIGLTRNDLQEVLHDLDAEPAEAPLQSSTNGPSREAAKSSMDEERASIQQCLKICMDVSSHIEQARAQHLADVRVPSSEETRSSGSTTSVIDKSNLARLITSEAMTDWQRGIGFTTIELQARLKDANRRLSNVIKHTDEGEEGSGGSGGGSGHKPEMRELLESVKACLTICSSAADQASSARVNVFEDVSMADDGNQVIVSTMGDLISARRVTAGARSTQWMGQMSDASLQQLSKDQIRDTSARDEAAEQQGQPVQPPTFERGLVFENRHGAGRTIPK